MSAAFQPEIGDFLSLRGREWLVQDKRITIIAPRS
jgi:hypothetical protein